MAGAWCERDSADPTLGDDEAVAEDGAPGVVMERVGGAWSGASSWRES